MDGLVDALYRTALDDGNWKPALTILADALRASEAAVTFWRTDSGNIAALHTTDRSADAGIVSRYREHFQPIDPKLPILANRKPGFVFNDAEHFDADFVRRNAFYQEFTLPAGWRHTLDMRAIAKEPMHVYLAIMRNKRQGPFDARSVEMLQRASAHFVRAAGLKEKFDDLDRAQRMASAGLDALSFGVAIVDENCRIVLLNRAAETLCAGHTDILVRQGKLAARSAASAAALNALLADALSAAHNGRTGSGGRTIELRDADGGVLNVSVAPFGAARMPGGLGRPGAIVLIGDPQQTARLRHDDLVSLYGLTQAEARLAAALADGRTLKDAAANAGVKISTVRSQLLSAMEKIGVKRQADLVRLLSSLPTRFLGNN